MSVEQFTLTTLLVFEQWATIRIEKGVPKESVLKNSASVGKSSFSFMMVKIPKLDKSTSTQFELEICRSSAFYRHWIIHNFVLYAK